MGPLEIFLIVIGAAIVVCSFVFGEKFTNGSNNDVEIGSNVLSVTKDIVEKEVKSEIAVVIDDEIEDLKLKLEKMSGEKIMALGEYSEEINSRIVKNHDEVMFLYDMLSEKEKTLKTVVRDIENLKISVKKMAVANDFAKQSAMKAQENKHNNGQINEITKESIKESIKETAHEATNENISIIQSNISNADEEIKTAAANDLKELSDVIDIEKKIANDNRKEESYTQEQANVIESLFETSLEENIDNTLDIYNSNTKNNNKEILDLYNQGKSNIEIAKELGLGIGEVKLVIDLFNTRK